MKPVHIKRSSWHYQLIETFDADYSHHLYCYGSDSCTYTTHVIRALLALVIVVFAVVVFTGGSLAGLYFIVFKYINWDQSYISTMVLFAVVLWWFLRKTYLVFSEESKAYKKYHFWHDADGNRYRTRWQAEEAYDKNNPPPKVKKESNFFGLKQMWQSLKDKHCSKLVLSRR